MYSYGLDRNETLWFGLKFQNNSENFRKSRNELQSKTSVKLNKLSYLFLKVTFLLQKLQV